MTSGVSLLFPYAKNPAGFVLDLMVPLAWLPASRVSMYAQGVLNRMPSKGAVVPASWLLDVAEHVAREERSGRLSRAQSAHSLAILQSFPILVDDNSLAPIWLASLDLARRHGITVSLAAYLELALRLGLPLATFDPVLKAAAPAAGVAVFVP